MIPILFDVGATSFTTLGIGVLSDAISCTVTEERNGEYYLEMKYPINGKYYELIQIGRIIAVYASEEKSLQAFDIVRIESNINGISKIEAEHVSYRLSGYIVTPFTSKNYTETSPSHALGQLFSHCKIACPFTYSTDLDNLSSATSFDYYREPVTLKSSIYGHEGSMVDVFGGECLFDNFSFKLLKNRGKNRGYKIVYGGNMTKLEQETDCRESFYGVVAYWAYTDDETDITTVVCSDTITDTKNSELYSYQKTKLIDATADYEEAPTVEQLNDYATSYLNRNRLSDVSVSINTTAAQFNDDVHNTRSLPVCLCDTVQVIYRDIGLNETAKVTKVVYDVLKEANKSFVVGTIKKTIVDDVYRNSIASATYEKRVLKL